MTTPASARLIAQAVAWWERKRPEGWTEDEHLKNPTVNCDTPLDAVFAKSAANVVRGRKSRQCKVCGASDYTHVHGAKKGS